MSNYSKYMYRDNICPGWVISMNRGVVNRLNRSVYSTSPFLGVYHHRFGGWISVPVLERVWIVSLAVGGTCSFVVEVGSE